MQENPKTIPESAEGMEYLVNLGRERTKIRTAVIDGHTYTVDTLRARGARVSQSPRVLFRPRRSPAWPTSCSQTWTACLPGTPAAL